LSHCYSTQRQKKQEGMHRLVGKRLEAELKKLADRLHKKRTTKRYDKVLVRIGRLRQKYPRATPSTIPSMSCTIPIAAWRRSSPGSARRPSSTRCPGSTACAATVSIVMRRPPLRRHLCTRLGEAALRRWKNRLQLTQPSAIMMAGCLAGRRTFDHARAGDLPPDALLRDVALTVQVRHRPGEEPPSIALGSTPAERQPDTLGKWMGVALDAKPGSGISAEDAIANRTVRGEQE